MILHPKAMDVALESGDVRAVVELGKPLDCSTRSRVRELGFSWTFRVIVTQLELVLSIQL